MNEKKLYNPEGQYFTAYDLNQKWTSNLRDAEEKR